MEIKFESGLKEYSLNDAVKVHFNPTDFVFAEKLLDTFSILEKKQDGYKSELADAKDPKQVFDVARKWDQEMREMLDGIFDVPVCEALFGTMNVYALADGLPVWCNLILAILDEIMANMDGAENKIASKIQKYTEKYKRK